TVLIVYLDPARERRMSFQACIDGAPGCWDHRARPAVLAAHENQSRGNNANRQSGHHISTARRRVERSLSTSPSVAITTAANPITAPGAIPFAGPAFNTRSSVQAPTPTPTNTHSVFKIGGTRPGERQAAKATATASTANAAKAMSSPA